MLNVIFSYKETFNLLPLFATSTKRRVCTWTRLTLGSYSYSYNINDINCI